MESYTSTQGGKVIVFWAAQLIPSRRANNITVEKWGGPAPQPPLHLHVSGGATPSFLFSGNHGSFSLTLIYSESDEIRLGNDWQSSFDLLVYFTPVFRIFPVLRSLCICVSYIYLYDCLHFT